MFTIRNRKVAADHARNVDVTDGRTTRRRSALHNGVVLGLTITLGCLGMPGLAQAATAQMFTPPAASVATAADTTGAFTHPGILLGTRQLSFVKTKIAAGEEPWTTGLTYAKAAKADTGTNSGQLYSSLAWTPRPVAYIGCGSFNNPDEGCYDSINDGVAAYTQALLWYYTGNTANAQQAIRILNAWSGKLIDHKFDTSVYKNGHLVAAWNGEVYTRAAEIIRYTYTAPAGKPAFNASQFSAMLKKAFLPHVINGWVGAGANWLLSMADATMDIGIFTDDRATFDNGVADWRAQVPAAIYLAGDTNTHAQLAGMPISPPGTMYDKSTTTLSSFQKYWYNPTRLVSGLEGETLRDPNHMAMGMGAMIDGAETARLQGVDLYGAEKKRIVAAMELNTGYVYAAVKGGQNPPTGWPGANPDDHHQWRVEDHLGDRLQRVREPLAHLDAEHREVPHRGRPAVTLADHLLHVLRDPDELRHPVDPLETGPPSRVIRGRSPHGDRPRSRLTGRMRGCPTAYR